MVGNKQSQLTFVTRWDLRLTAAQDGDRIELELPINAPQPVPAERFEQLAAAVCGELPVADTQLSEQTGKLLLRLDDGCTVLQLEELRVRGRGREFNYSYIVFEKKLSYVHS